MGQWARWHVQPWPYIQMAHALMITMSCQGIKVKRQMQCQMRRLLSKLLSEKYIKQVKSQS